MNQRFPYILRISEKAKRGAAKGPKRAPSWLRPVVMGVVAAGVIVCGIYYWGFVIPAEKQKAAEAERQASEEKQKFLYLEQSPHQCC